MPDIYIVIADVVRETFPIAFAFCLVEKIISFTLKFMFGKVDL